MRDGAEPELIVAALMEAPLRPLMEAAEANGLLSGHWRGQPHNGLGCLTEIKEEQESSPRFPCEERIQSCVPPLGDCASSGLFEQKVSPRLARRQISVCIVSARGLRNADWLPGTGCSDPYCICEIPGKPNSKFQTLVVDNCLDPVWDREEEMEDYVVGDSLLFTVYDQDTRGRGDLLGQVEMESGQFHPDGFEGELPLANAGRNIQAFLRIRVSPAQVLHFGDVVEGLLETPRRMQQHLLEMEEALANVGANAYHEGSEDSPLHRTALEEQLEEYRRWQETASEELQMAQQFAEEKEEQVMLLEQQVSDGEAVRQELQGQVLTLAQQLAAEGRELQSDGEAAAEAHAQLLEDLRRELTEQQRMMCKRLSQQEEEAARELASERHLKQEAEESAARHARLALELQHQLDSSTMGSEQEDQDQNRQLFLLQKELENERGHRLLAEAQSLEAEDRAQELRRSLTLWKQQVESELSSQQAALGDATGPSEDAQQLQQQEEALRERDRQLDSLRQELEDERRKRAFADEQHASLDKIVRELQLQLEDNRRINDELRRKADDKVSSSEGQTIKMEQQLALLSKQLECERRERQASEARALQGEGVIQELQRQLSDELGKRQEAQRGLATAIDQQVSTLTRQLHEQAATSEGRIEALQLQLQEEAAKRCELQQALEDLTEERERMLRQAAEGLASHQATQQQLLEMQRTHQGLSADREQLLQQIAQGEAARQAALDDAAESRKQVKEFQVQLEEELAGRKQAVEEAVRQGVQQLFGSKPLGDISALREKDVNRSTDSSLPSAAELQAARTEAHINELQRQLSVELSERMALKAMVAKQEEQLRSLQLRFAERGSSRGPTENGSFLANGPARRIAPRELSRPRTGEEPVASWEGRPVVVLPPSGPGLPSRAGVTPRGVLSSAAPAGGTPPMGHIPPQFRPVGSVPLASSHPRLAQTMVPPAGVPVARSSAPAAAASQARSPMRSHSPVLARQRPSGPPAAACTVMASSATRPGSSTPSAAPASHSVAASPARCRTGPPPAPASLGLVSAATSRMS